MSGHFNLSNHEAYEMWDNLFLSRLNSVNMIFVKECYKL